MKRIALLIAVEQPADAQFPKSEHAGADALALSKALAQHGYHEADQVVLVDAAATKTAVESRVRTTVAALTKEDALVFCYVGRGFSVAEAEGGVNRLACFDTQSDDLPETSASLDKLLERLLGAGCKRTMLFLDLGPRGTSEGESLPIGGEFDDAALLKRLGQAEHAACFVACRAGEKSYASPARKQGWWVQHLLDALGGDAPEALGNATFVTAGALQQHLADSTPRSVRSEYHGRCLQSPWKCGGALDETPLFDVSKILKAKKAAALPSSAMLADVRLITRWSEGVKKMRGFQKSHRVPTSASPRDQKFIQELAGPVIAEDLQKTYDALKNAFAFKRVDLVSHGPDEGGGSISTPYFNYEIFASLDPENPAKTLWRRQIVGIRDPEKVMSAAFAEAFGKAFDTLELETRGSIDIAAVVDRIEEVGGDTLTVKYDRDLAWCRIALKGVKAELQVDAGGLQVVDCRDAFARELIEAFFALQRSLLDTHNVKALASESTTRP